jgi:hypothetical protein
MQIWKFEHPGPPLTYDAVRSAAGYPKSATSRSTLSQVYACQFCGKLFARSDNHCSSLGRVGRSYSPGSIKLQTAPDGMQRQGHNALMMVTKSIMIVSHMAV